MTEYEEIMEAIDWMYTHLAKGGLTLSDAEELAQAEAEYEVMARFGVVEY